jgi:tRNA A-37 threonylcarbamoyl transferase component Bud32
MKFLGKGSYGCAYRPALPCKGSPVGKNVDTIGKIFFSNSDFLKEITVYYNVKMYDTDDKLLPKFYPYKTCVVNMDDPGVKDSLNKCSMSRMKFPVLQMIIDYGGSELRTMLKESGHTRKFTEFVKPIGLLVKNLREFNQKGIIHNDIKSDNVVVKLTKKGVISSMQLIDVSLAKSDMNIVNDDNHDKYYYRYYAPEHWLLYALNSTKISLADLKNKYIQGVMSQLEDHRRRNTINTRDVLHNLIISSIDKLFENIDSIYSVDLSTYYDSFSLGLVILEIFANTDLTGVDQTAAMVAIFRMIDPNPVTRDSGEAAMVALQKACSPKLKKLIKKNVNEI